MVKVVDDSLAGYRMATKEEREPLLAALRNIPDDWDWNSRRFVKAFLRKPLIWSQEALDHSRPIDNTVTFERVILTHYPSGDRMAVIVCGDLIVDEQMLLP